MFKTNQAVILARVSSDDQTDNFSTPAQIRRGQEYCQKNDLRVLEVFEFTESATKGKRKVFWEVMKYAEKRKLPLALVVDCVDRLMRGYKEISYLEEKITSGQLELHFIQDSLVLNSKTFLENTGIWEMKILMARQYAVSIMKNTRRGNEEARHRGEAFRVPIGYIRKDNVVTLHPKSHLITELFENMAYKNWTTVDCYNFVKENAMDLFSTKAILNQKIMQSMTRIFSNTFYYGEVKGGKHTYNHKYTPLVTKEVFCLVQEKIKARRTNNKCADRYDETKDYVQIKPFVYRGLIKCEGCGWHLTGYDRTKKYTTGLSQTFTYYRCCNRDCNYVWKQISEKKMNEKMSEVLANIKISNATKQALIQHVKNMIEYSSKDNNRGREIVKEELENVTKKIDRLLELSIAGHIDNISYLGKKDELVKRQAELMSQMTDTHNDKSKILDVAMVVINCCNQLSDIWEKSENHTKIDIIKRLCVNLSYLPQNPCIQLKKPFAQLSEKGIKIALNQKWLRNESRHRTSDAINMMTNCNNPVKPVLDYNAFSRYLIHDMSAVEQEDILSLRDLVIF
jgi:site-specific DNA recombinase